MQHEKSCGAVVFTRTDKGVKYLLIANLKGIYGFPKGHVEAGETEEQTALREIREETGLIVQLENGFRQCVEYYPKPNVKKQVVYFLASLTDPTAQPIPQKEEVSELRWMNTEEANTLVTFRNDRRLIDKAKEFLNSNTK